ncbi:MAG TPA: 30S ribosomal protein S5, partial [Bacillota bacterium]|nr:30S ribosomal protein S5 [Bacillota bacterium]
MSRREPREKESEFKEQMISLNRVSKTVKGGRIARFAALMV